MDKLLAPFPFSDPDDRVPSHALVAGVDLVAIRFDADVSVPYGRCAQRGALMSDRRLGQGSVGLEVVNCAWYRGSSVAFFSLDALA